MYIETERLIIRPFTIEDVSDMHELFILPNVMKPVGMAPAHTKIEESRERIIRWTSLGLHQAITMKETGKVIGYIVVKPDSEEMREDTRELGFALNPKFWHQGFMTETIKEIIEYLRAKGIRYVWACCFLDNLASKTLIERCGFLFQSQGEYFVESEQMTYPSLEYRMELITKEKSNYNEH